MRYAVLPVLVLALAIPLCAQSKQRVVYRNADAVATADAMIKGAAELLANDRKAIERDIQVLRQLRQADAALADDMQPSNALEKAHDAVSKAKDLGPEFYVMQGVIKAEQALDDARRSPSLADLSHLRTIVRDDALRPASRVAIRNAQRLQEETVAWLSVQQLITNHLKTLSDLEHESLQAAEQP